MGLGFRVQVQGLGLGVYRVEGLGFIGFWGLGFRVYRVWGLGVWGVGV